MKFKTVIIVAIIIAIALKATGAFKTEAEAASVYNKGAYQEAFELLK